MLFYPEAQAPARAVLDAFSAQLHEQYRPREWSEIVGQEKVIARIRQIAKRGLAGRAYWLSGQSGTGKTTIARLIAAEVASAWCIEESGASTNTSVTGYVP